MSLQIISAFIFPRSWSILLWNFKKKVSLVNYRLKFHLHEKVSSMSSEQDCRWWFFLSCKREFVLACKCYLYWRLHTYMFYWLLSQAFCDLEPIYTYEGTYDINSMVTAREITGIASFKPATLRKSSRLWYHLSTSSAYSVNFPGINQNLHYWTRMHIQQLNRRVEKNRLCFHAMTWLILSMSKLFQISNLSL